MAQASSDCVRRAPGAIQPCSGAATRKKMAQGETATHRALPRYPGMILRDPEDGARLLIPQPAHALLSGQMLAAWGAPGFAGPEPAPEVILAASQHDIAWMPWEAAPTLDPETGLPHSFMALGAATHAPMWARGVELARAAWGHWPALLISRHGTLIYTRYANPDRETAADRTATEHYQAEQSTLQTAWAEALGADPALVESNSALIAATDALSLALCFGRPLFAPEAPTIDGGRARLELARSGEGPWSLSPWPFREDSLTLRCEAIRIPAAQRWTEEETMRHDLRNAPRTTLTETLHPG
ncbi:Protein of unknown function [Roseomonas rosea]|uniref:DUF3891 domain-containing protein n=1 Tax=Muricoccus roseus TaxID=198092 RepID=A0A1M6JVR9_9PROT|nr:DUF3891 family protein [Roseomonas rosea]SHJ50742.1 Protein of unknown function [Roseomonas rosea]